MISFEARTASRDAFHYSRLFRALSNLAFQGWSIHPVSLGNLCHCLTPLTERNFSLTCNLILSTSGLKLLFLVLSLPACVKSHSRSLLQCCL